MKLFASAVLSASSFALAQDTYSIKVLNHAEQQSCELIKPLGLTQLHRGVQGLEDTLVEVTPRQNKLSAVEIELHESIGSQNFVEVFGQRVDSVQSRINELCPNGIRSKNLRAEPAATAVIKKLVDSGDPKNRIDVVFMGDGYTSNEQTRFFDDIKRLTNDMFTGDTFAQYLPLFNIWAAYVPSAESGIGIGGQPLDTAFGLYRDGTELRGVYTTKPDVARRVCAQTGQYACDFPSLIGNDDFYGGLGGEFVIATRSPTTGTMVLRHEMGHNFGKVGEEYDGGQVYSGANSASSVSRVTWKHWLTEPTKFKAEKWAQLYQKHIWHDLEDSSYKIKFTSTGAYKRWYIILSVSGTDTDDSLTVTLDGEPLAWTSRGVKDRTFYTWTSNDSGFSKGNHVLEIEAGGSFDSPIIKQLCNAEVSEFMGEDEYHIDDPEFIGIYPTYNINKRVTYRPNNEKCLMRNMTSPKFCNVCQENMWQQFMSRISFIDDVVVSGKKVDLEVIPLGQLRPRSDSFVQSHAIEAAGEKYTVTWLNSGREITKFRDQFSVDTSTVATSSNQWTVRVQFTTPSVRVDSKKVMTSEKSFTV